MLRTVLAAQCHRYASYKAAEREIRELATSKTLASLLVSYMSLALHASEHFWHQRTYSELVPCLLSSQDPQRPLRADGPIPKRTET